MYNDTNEQMLTAVNQGLVNMNLQPTEQLAGNVLTMIYPFIANEMNKATQSNQIAVNALSMVQQLMLQNQFQIMQIAKLKQKHNEMPRLFAENPVTGCGYCLDNGGEKQIGIIKINSVYECTAEKNRIRRKFKYVFYRDSGGEYHHTVIPLDKLAGKHLLTLFEGFIYVCRSKELANDYLAHCINNFQKPDSVFFPEYPGFVFFFHKNKERAVFHCNNGLFEMELLKECSVHYMKKVISKGIPSHGELKSITEKYLNTNEKRFLFMYAVCGVLSSFLKEIHYPMEQNLVISAPNAAAVRLASYYLQIFNRGSNPLSFDSSKSDIRKALLHSKDETVVISDCSIIDNDARRTDMLQYILMTNDSNECQPHNLAIFSSHAQYILPAEKKICLTLPDDFAMPITKAEEIEMCRALDSVVNYITDTICNNYAAFKKFITEDIERNMNGTEISFDNIETKTSFSIISSILFYLMYHNESIHVKEDSLCSMEAFISDTLMNSNQITGSSADAIAEQFIKALNQAIRENELKILIHSKKMNYVPNAHQLIIKGNLLVMEEQIINEIIIPHMRTTDSVCRILKSLESGGHLHSTKKKRYLLTVYTNGKSIRPTFIALHSEGILDLDVERLIRENQYSEWFTSDIVSREFIPIMINRIGQTAYQQFDFEKATNMHFFAIGQSGSGKTHCLTERMCSLQKLHHPIIILDTSDSFTKESVLEKLSADGDEAAVQKVRKYIKNHIIFHKIEEKGLPVDILKLDYSQNKESKIREIQSVIESHNSNMGVKQKATVYRAINCMVSENNIDMARLYELLTSEDIPYNLAEQLMDTLSCFMNFERSEKNWGEFIDESNDIIIISTHAVSASGDSGLIVMLLMSLFCYQRTHPNKHLSIFIDEIKYQNLSPKGPIATILTEGRKYHIGLNFAAQYLPCTSAETTMVMENADIKVFFRLDGKAASSAAKQIDISPNVLVALDTGECYIKGSFWNNRAGRIMPGIIHGRTYRNFVIPEYD